MRTDVLTSYSVRHNFLRKTVVVGEEDLLANEDFQTAEIVAEAVLLFEKYDDGYNKL